MDQYIFALNNNTILKLLLNILNLTNDIRNRLTMPRPQNFLIKPLYDAVAILSLILNLHQLLYSTFERMANYITIQRIRKIRLFSQ